MPLRTLHRASAMLLAAFAAVHIANHAASLWSVDAHIAFMEAARGIYRRPAAEGLLLACVAFQASTGIALLISGWRDRRGRVAWLQAASGALLALFLSLHVSAVLFARSALHLDTNFYFAAAGLHVAPFRYFFAPYYFLAVLALFTHLGCVAWWLFAGASMNARRAALGLSVLAGAGVSMLLVLALAGVLQPVDIPPKYRATFARDADGQWTGFRPRPEPPPSPPPSAPPLS